MSDAPGVVNPDDVVVLEKDSRTKCMIHMFGATLISWIHKGEELIFLSTKAKFDNKTAIRGGIPIVFPNFGPWALGPQHGFARSTRWTLEKPAKQDESSGAMIVVLSLSETEESLKLWNYQFKLTYTVILSDNSLKTSFAVNNNSCDAFSFTCLLHTYFRVPDVAKSTVSNLCGLTYYDKTKGGVESREERDLVVIDRCVDYTYRNTLSQHKITGVTGGKSILLEKFNFPDTVVWNPWKEKATAMSDLGDEYVNMLCVEVGHVVTPVELASSGGTWEAHQVLTVVDAD